MICACNMHHVEPVLNNHSENPKGKVLLNGCNQLIFNSLAPDSSKRQNPISKWLLTTNQPQNTQFVIFTTSKNRSIRIFQILQCNYSHQPTKNLVFTPRLPAAEPSTPCPKQRHAATITGPSTRKPEPASRSPSYCTSPFTVLWHSSPRAHSSAFAGLALFRARARVPRK